MSKIIYQPKIAIFNGIYCAKNLNEIKKKAVWKITKAGSYESMVHSVEITQKTINYKIW